MADDLLLNKAAAIERAVGRVREEFAGDDRNLLTNQTRLTPAQLYLRHGFEMHFIGTVGEAQRA